MVPFTPLPDWHIGPLTVNIHSLMFMIGALTAYVWTYKRTPKEYQEHLDHLACWMTVFGILGARLLFVILYPHLIASPWRAFCFWEGGLVSYGGFVGAIATWIIYIRRHQLPMNVLCDALGPAAVMGWGLGRIGCWLSWNGEIGTPTTLPWGFIVNGDVPRHPVMLYLASAHITMALLSIPIARRFKVNTAAPALIAFGGVRVVLDTWRFYDPFWLHYGSVAFSMLFVILGCLAWKRLTPVTSEISQP